MAFVINGCFSRGPSLAFTMHTCTLRIQRTPLQAGLGVHLLGHPSSLSLHPNAFALVLCALVFNQLGHTLKEIWLFPSTAARWIKAQKEPLLCAGKTSVSEGRGAGLGVPEALIPSIPSMDGNHTSGLCPSKHPEQATFWGQCWKLSDCQCHALKAQLTHVVTVVTSALYLWPLQLVPSQHRSPK